MIWIAVSRFWIDVYIVDIGLDLLMEMVLEMVLDIELLVGGW